LIGLGNRPLLTPLYHVDALIGLEPPKKWQVSSRSINVGCGSAPSVRAFGPRNPLIEFAPEKKCGDKL
jgi:hypothetical protein